MKPNHLRSVKGRLQKQENSRGACKLFADGGKWETVVRFCSYNAQRLLPIRLRPYSRWNHSHRKPSGTAQKRIQQEN